MSAADVDPRRRLVVGAKLDPGGPPVRRRDAGLAADHQLRIEALHLRFERVRLDDHHLQVRPEPPDGLPDDLPVGAWLDSHQNPHPGRPAKRVPFTLVWPSLDDRRTQPSSPRPYGLSFSSPYGLEEG